MKQLALIGLTFASLTLTAGCGGESVPRSRASGSITYDGTPVAAGTIYFNPDASLNNDGPQGFADIKNGRYDTRASGKGGAAGAVIVRVEGFDGQPEDGRPMGHPLFVYETKMELGKGKDTAKDFAITAAEAPKLEKSTHPRN